MAPSMWHHLCIVCHLLSLTPRSGVLISTRGALAIVMGCIPVFVGHFLRPFQSTLGLGPFNYSHFSITVGPGQLNQIKSIIQQANYSALKYNLDRVWHHFSWATVYNRQYGDEPFESDALAVMLDMLCRHRRVRLPQGSPLLSLPCPESKVTYLI